MLKTEQCARVLFFVENILSSYIAVSLLSRNLFYHMNFQVQRWLAIVYVKYILKRQMSSSHSSKYFSNSVLRVYRRIWIGVRLLTGIDETAPKWISKFTLKWSGLKAPAEPSCRVPTYIVYFFKFILGEDSL